MIVTSAFWGKMIITVVLCNKVHQFIKFMGEWEAAKGQVSLRLQTPLGQSCL